MSVLIILILFGLGVAYFATQNTGLVHVTVANFFTGGIPLYLVVIGAMLLGIFVSWLISIVETIASALKIHGKETELRDAYRIIEKITKKNEALQLENVHLKGEQEIPLVEEGNSTNAQEEQIVSPSSSFFHRPVSIKGKAA